MLGTNNVQVGAMYGDLCGRDFTIEQQTITVTLPEGAGETTGYIYVEIDTSAETPLSVGSALAPFTPTYEDINVNGAVAQMIVAEYTADAVAVVSITPVYKTVSAGGIGSLATIETSPTKTSHAAGTYLVYDGKLYITLTSIATGEVLTIGTNISATTAGDELSALKSGLTMRRLAVQLSINGTIGIANLGTYTFGIIYGEYSNQWYSMPFDVMSIESRHQMYISDSAYIDFRGSLNNQSISTSNNKGFGRIVCVLYKVSL
jgi:hypothetical protein